MSIPLLQLVAYLDSLFPIRLAEKWDHVGLLVGDSERIVRRVMCCLTVTPRIVEEAVRERVDMVVSHHPFPFHALQRIVEGPDKEPVGGSIDGGMMLNLIEGRVAVYSPHTAHDSGHNGVNAQLAGMFGLGGIRPLVPDTEDPGVGTGRIGKLPQPASLLSLVHFLKERLSLPYCHYVGEPGSRVQTLAVCCGAADDFIATARSNGADVLVLGEARFHACLEAESLGLALLLPGHYPSERFAMDRLADRITADWPTLECFASRCENDPVKGR